MNFLKYVCIYCRVKQDAAGELCCSASSHARNGMHGGTFLHAQRVRSFMANHLFLGIDVAKIIKTRSNVFDKLLEQCFF